eukprot:COSAG02_NODE_9057_length_2346_cov_3.805964_2_plen_68_part_00
MLDGPQVAARLTTWALRGPPGFAFYRFFGRRGGAGRRRGAVVVASSTFRHRLRECTIEWLHATTACV